MSGELDVYTEIRHNVDVTPLRPERQRTMTSLCNISDSDLISKLKRIISKDRHLEAELLAHLGEVDARKLYAKEAYSSMFAYCTQVLHFPEYSAYKRIAVARAARRLKQPCLRLLRRLARSAFGSSSPPDE